MRRIFGVSASVAIVALLSLLFLPAAFFVRICRANEWRRLTFPPAVNLKRLAAPLCVFSFMFWCFRRLRAPRSRFRSENRYKIGAFHLWPRFHGSKIGKFLDQPIQ